MLRLRKLILIIFSVSFGNVFCQDQKVVEHYSAPRVLLVDGWRNLMPSGLITAFSQAKTFAQHETFFVTLLWDKTYLEGLYTEHNLLYEKLIQSSEYVNYNQFLKNNVYRICSKYKINTVITFRWQDVPSLLTLAEQVYPFKVILCRIGTLEEDPIRHHLHFLQGLDGFVSSAKIVEYISKVNRQKKLDIKHIAAITPFWDEYKCAHCNCSQQRQEYFKERFAIEANQLPVVCTIANMSNPCKNYPLLFKALHILLYEKNRSFHAMLAGDGPLKESLEKIVKDLKLENYVHFLGSIQDTPSLLYHSDIHILPSYYENFPLANLEAAAMKKPIILTAGIDASYFINHNESGLLFKNNDAYDLAQKIEYLLDNPQERNRMGQNAYAQVQTVYSNSSLYKKWMTFLEDVLKS